MPWVLMLLISTFGSSGGNAITTAQFASKELCEAGGQEAVKMGEAGYLRTRVD